MILQSKKYPTHYIFCKIKLKNTKFVCVNSKPGKMSININQTFIAFNINGKPIKLELINSDETTKKADLKTNENIINIIEIENLKTFALNKTSRFLIDFTQLVQSDLSVFNNCILFISNFSFSKDLIIDKLIEKGNQIQIISKIDSAENFIKKLQFCKKNGIGLIIDIRELSNGNWNNYELESKDLGLLYHNNFNPTSKNSKLQDLRAKIEACDNAIYEQFALRMAIIDEIAHLKKSDMTEAFQPSKFIENILSLINNKKINEENKLDVIKLYQTLHDMAVERQKKII